MLDNSPNQIQIKTREGKTINVSESIKNYSKFIKEALEGI